MFTDSTDSLLIQQKAHSNRKKGSKTDEKRIKKRFKN